MNDADEASPAWLSEKLPFSLAYVAVFGFLLAVSMVLFLLGARASVGLHNNELMLVSLQLLILTGAVCFGPFALQSGWQQEPWRFTLIAAAIFFSPLLAFFIGIWLLPVLFVLFALGATKALRHLRSIDP